MQVCTSNRSAGLWQRIRSRGTATGLMLIVALIGASPICALVQDAEIPERPATEELLPETVVALIQVDNFSDLIEKMRESSGGQLLQDESVEPLVDGLWDDAIDLYDQNARDQVGMDLQDLTQLPEGELTFAVIAPRRANPEFFLLMELNNDDEILDQAMNRARDLIKEELSEEEELETTESEDGFSIEKFRADDRIVHFFRHEDTLVGCTSEEELNAFIDRWMGREVEGVRPLTANRKFVTIMNRCLGTDDLAPEARFFVDPISLAKSSFRGNIGAQAAINFLPIIGLDGLLGVGGSMLLSEEDFESVVHAHILLSSPRKGVFEMLALKPSDYEPDSWVPASTNNYMSTSWDVQKMFAELTTMIEMVQGEGVVEEAIENNINSELDIDFVDDVLGSLDGRITFVQWVEQPARMNSNITAVGIRLADVERFEEVVGKVLDRIDRDRGEDDDERVAVVDYRGYTIWTEPEGRAERRNERMRERMQRRGGDSEDGELNVAIEMNAQSPAVAIIGDTVVATSSRNFIEAAIDTELGDVDALRDDEDFREISDQMSKLLENELPAAVFYQNPEESIKMLLDVVKSDNAKELLAQGAAASDVAARFRNRLQDNPLPDFEKIQSYFTKSGGFATSDDTGYHFLFFNRKPDIDSDR